MSNILHIISSTNGAQSVSIQLGNAIVAKLQAANPGSTVKTVNLTAQPIPHLDEALTTALRTPQDKRTAEDVKLLERSDEAVRDLFAADTIVVGVPLINFSIPSSLKAWVDNIVRAGVTFSYTEKGIQGLVTGRKVYIALASGGIYSEGPMQAYDHAVPYLVSLFNSIGLKDIEVVRAEGLGMPVIQDTALEKAVNSVVV